MESSSESKAASILFIEPFYGGSHKQLMDIIRNDFKHDETELVTMSAKKWHWRARSSALWLSQAIPWNGNFRVLFASSVLNLAELVALRPDLNSLKKIIYFHENQLVYPVRKHQDRDFQYGYNQILTCLVADVVVFNSEFNRSSFIEMIPKFLKLQPDYRPKGLGDQIQSKSVVLYFPIYFPMYKKKDHCSQILHIIWPHRWEHDKDPETFFDCLFAIAGKGCTFTVSVLGEVFKDIPQIFHEAKDKLKELILNWGFVPSKEEYFNILTSGDIVVSTAKHEFFGVAMLEATYFGCFPLCPNRLVYPELFPRDCLYNNPEELSKKLEDFVINPDKLRSRKKNLDIDLQKFCADRLLPQYKELLCS